MSSPGAEKPRDSSETPGSVRALSRGLKVLSELSEERPEISVTELSQRLGLHKTTVSRLVRTLEAEGFLAAAGSSRLYGPGPSWMSALWAIGPESILARHQHSALESLAQATGETSSMAIRRGDKVDVVTTVLSPNPFRPTVARGRVVHMSETWNVHVKIHLAYADPETRQRVLTIPAVSYTPATIMDAAAREAALEQVVRDELAFDHEERGAGLCGVGVPVFDLSGQLAASLILVAPVERFGVEKLKLYVSELRASAARMTESLPRHMASYLRTYENPIS